MLTTWHESHQYLVYRLSYLPLWRKRFRVWACEIGLDPEPVPIDIPPPQPLDPKLEGFVMRGIPIAERRPLVEIRDGFVIYTPFHFDRGFIDLSQSFEDYQSKFSSRTRATIRRKVRKFASSGTNAPVLRTYTRRDEVREFLDTARDLSAKTYQERLLEAGLPSSAAFTRRALELADRDCIRAFILFHDGTPAAYLYLEAVGDTLVYDYTGYDPAYQRMSAGTVLHWLALERLFEEDRYRILDFTEGDGAQKELFRTGHKLTASVYCLRNNLPNRIAVRLHILVSWLSSFVGRMLNRFGLKTKLKHILRSADG